MWEFFWFSAGALVYSVLINFNFFSKKTKFVEDIRNIAFQLVGSAYEDLVSARALKYKYLINDPTIDDEKIKAFENEDETFMYKWKKEAVIKLNDSVPPLYRASLDIETWKVLMNHLDSYYKRTVVIKKDKKDNE
jgi:hypothetical protein